MNYRIKDMNSFVEKIRDSAAKSLINNKEYEQNLDDFITLAQITKIVINSNIVKDDSNIIISDKIYRQIHEEVRQTIYQSGLSRLASAGHIECAWDSDKDKMVFWINSKNGQLDIGSLPT